MSDIIINWSENQGLLIDLALHYISTLRKLVHGEVVSREPELQNYAKKHYNIELRPNQLRGLFHPQSTGGRFIDLGLDARTEYWLSKKLDESVEELDEIETTLQEKMSNITHSAKSIQRVVTTPRIRKRMLTTPKIHISEESAIDLDPPKRKDVFTTRVIRDTRKSNELKLLYQWKCQICGLSIEIPGKKKYCEVHHLVPLGGKHIGPDNKENMICLCPNHHAQMDYGVLYIEPTSLIVFHSDSTNAYHTKKIQLKGNHKPAQRYLEYHRDEVCSFWLD